MRTTKELNILMAEDNPDDVFLLREAFRKAGVVHILRDVCDGLETVAYLKGEGLYADRSQYPFPDILLLDLNMPRMNGFEVLEWLRQDEKCRQLVTHVLTASCREADVKKAYDIGANCYVLKPARLDELVAFAAALQQWHQFLCLPPKPQMQELVLQGEF